MSGHYRATGELLPGTRLSERFEIESVAGAGGMGMVYRARDLVSREPSAVKVLNDLGGDEGARFDREARILLELRHPNVVRYVAHGAALDGRRYLAMEWLEGEDLADRLCRGALSITEVVHLGAQLARALGAAHQRGIVHRDIKPSNVFLVGGDAASVRLLDFGVARSKARAGSTRDGAIIGTPGYMSPEQARGVTEISPAADLFALGAVLYECLAGSPAFSGDQPVAVLAKVVLEEVPVVSELRPEVPAVLGSLVAQLLEKEPSARPESATEVARQLDEIRHGGDSDAPPSRRLGGRLHGERKLASVVLAGPVHQRSLGEARAALESYAEDVDVLVGGSLVAVIAGSAAAVDQATAGARAAFELAAMFPDARVALATGRGELAGRLPVGEVIDHGVLLLRESGERGVVVVDELTAGLIESRFELRTSAGRTYLVAERSAAAGGRRLLGRETPCVGRARELNVLRGLYRQCVEESVSRAVIVTGASGAGKSRLRFELLRGLEPEDQAVWLGRADPLAAGSPHQLVASALRSGLELPIEQDPEPARRALTEALDGQVAREDVPFIGELLRLSFDDSGDPALRAARRDPALMADRLRRALADVLRARAERQPLVLVLEDAHWGDAPSFSLVESALQRAGDVPLLVLVLGRPELVERFPDLLQRNAATQLLLRPLSPKASAKLVREVLDDVDDDRVADIVERAGGNAFHLEELIRASAAGSGDVPDTVLAMMHARLEEVEPDARRVLRAASVFGKRFWRSGVAALLGGDATRLLEWLPILEERELVERRAECRYPGEQELAFRHGLVRDAAYETLTEEDKRVGHRLAGDWLERAGEAVAALLAEHFERGDVPARAVGWLLTAARHAIEAREFQRAIQLAERALNEASGTQRGRSLALKAEACRWLGTLEEARTAAERARAELEPGSPEWFRATSEAVLACGRLGRYRDVLALQREVVAIEPDDGGLADKVICLCAAARQVFHAGRYGEAEAVMARIEQLVPALSSADAVAAAEFHRLRGASARHRGDLAADLAGYERALDAFELIGDVRSAANARVSVGFARAEVGDFEGAAAELQRALESAAVADLPTIATRARQNLALVLSARGDHGRARALAQRVCEESRASGNVRFEGWTRIYASQFALRDGDAHAALREAEIAVELLGVTPPALAGALAARSRALAAVGRKVDAATDARRGGELLEQLGSIEEFGPLVRLALVEALLSEGRNDDARRELERARERLRVATSGLDPVETERCVRNVPEHRELDRLFRAHVESAARGRYETESFREAGHRLVDLLAEHLESSMRGEGPVVRWSDPEQMRARWSLEGRNGDDVVELATALVHQSVHQHHPRSMAHQVSSPMPELALLDLAGAVLNNGMAAFESGPASSAMEDAVVRHLCGHLGWGGDADGVLTSGGSLGNLTALLAARQSRAGYDAWTEPATSSQPLAVLCGSEVHYSVSRAVQVMGWGAGGAIPVASDARFRMDPAELPAALERAVADGRRVIGVVASTGSTSTGAIDPLDRIADFCAERDLWLHVDGAHGASALLSPRYRDALRGIERADSVVWDAHKLMQLPALATAVLFRSGDSSYESLRQSAVYLYEPGARTWQDRGLRTIECTKRMISVPLYGALALIGSEELGRLVESRFDLARWFAGHLRQRQGFEVATEPDCNIVCFRCVPSGFGGDVDELQQRIRTDVFRSGEFTMSQTRVRGRMHLRVAVMNPLTGESELRALADLIERRAPDLIA